LLGNLDLLAGKYNGSLHDDFQKMDLRVLEEKVLSSYPELLLSKAVRTAAEAQGKLARAERYPDLEIGVGAGRERGIVENSHTLEWAVSIPLPIFDRNQGRILETKMLALKAEEEYRSVLNNVRLNVEKTFLSFENILDQARAFKEKVLPQAEKSLALMMEGYQVGKFTHIDLLDAQRTLTDMRENYINLLRELNGMAIEIERFAGQPVHEIR
jgi:cobalt-zinc-cadmium efflux system outer membrane protein